MKDALSSYIIEGLTQNISMHLRVLGEEAFVSGDFHTNWLETLYA
jgi:biotin carboxylase